MDIYDIFFSICLGLFIGGLLFSIISVFLAQMESQSVGQEIDTDVDIDADIDIDVDVDVDVDAEKKTPDEQTQTNTKEYIVDIHLFSTLYYY